MQEESSILEKAFDHLSAVPFLRKIMKNLWMISTIFLGLMILIEITSIKMNKIKFRKDFLKTISLFILINSFFARIFFLWDKREKKLKLKKKK
ncbi:MAG: hypothetical protein K1060chlam5_00996 [Candidatus Anoxychlamydiales bacterium]|nr:hypothetical protein [Candidatus Anoxychlamydiales bacterium]